MECHKIIDQLTGYAGKEFKFSMDIQSLIDGILNSNMNVLDCPIAIKSDDGGNSSPN